MNIMKFILVGATIIALAGCCACRKGKSNAAMTLTGVTWQADKIGSGSLTPQDDSFTLRFDADNKVSGCGACNRFFGSYRSDAEGKLTFGELGATKMMCPDMELEDRMFDALHRTVSYSFDSRTLLLLDGAGEVVAVFSPKEE